MARTKGKNTGPQYTEAALEQAYRDGRRGKTPAPAAGALYLEWERGYTKWKAANAPEEEEPKPKRRRRNPPGEINVERERPKKSRRTVAPGEPPLTYHAPDSWPRGGYVKINSDEEDEFCWAKKVKFEKTGNRWVTTGHCGVCTEKKVCKAWLVYRKHLREEYGI